MSGAGLTSGVTPSQSYGYSADGSNGAGYYDGSGAFLGQLAPVGMGGPAQMPFLDMPLDYNNEGTQPNPGDVASYSMPGAAQQAMSGINTQVFPAVGAQQTAMPTSMPIAMPDMASFNIGQPQYSMPGIAQQALNGTNTQLFPQPTPTQTQPSPMGQTMSSGIPPQQPSGLASPQGLMTAQNLLKNPNVLSQIAAQTRQAQQQYNTPTMNQTGGLPANMRPPVQGQIATPATNGLSQINGLPSNMRPPVPQVPAKPLPAPGANLIKPGVKPQAFTSKPNPAMPKSNPFTPFKPSPFARQTLPGVRKK